MPGRRFFVVCTYCVLSLCGARALEIPRLWITNTALEGIVTWPAGLSSWVLEESTNEAAGAAWTAVPSQRYETNNALAQTRFFLENSTHLFRLRKVLSPIPNLTGLWTFDEATAGSANSGGATSQALQMTNTTLDTGRIGARALRFDGDGRAWITNAGYTVLPSNGSPFTVSFWFSTGTNRTGRVALAGNQTTGGSGWHLSLNTAGPGTNELIFASCTLSITGSTRVLPQQWHHVTATVQPGETRLYLDGTLLASGTGDVCTHDGPVSFGGGIAAVENFTGRLDELRLFSRALSADEIAVNGRWQFDGGEAGIGSDSGVYGNHAQMTGEPLPVAGRSGTALDLRSAALTINNAYHRVLPASGGAFGLSFWLRPQSVPDSGRLMSQGGVDGGWHLGVDRTAEGKLELEFCSTNSGGTLALRAPIALTNGVWTKIDVNYNGGIASLSADGREIGSASGAIRGSTSALVIGGTNGFDGAVDDLEIHSRERSKAEIGPVAEVSSETVFVQGTTNIVLRGMGRNGRPLIYEIVPAKTPTNGVIVQAPGSPVVMYIAGARKGPDAFAYTVSDGEFTSAPAIVNVSVVRPHWLSPEGSGNGSGTGPENAYMAGDKDALNAIWRTNNYYDCFFYAPGTYLTKGWRFEDRITANPGCKHVGSGRSGAPEGTTLRLVDVLEPWSEGAVFAGYNGLLLCDDFEVHNMLIDCNSTNLPTFTHGEPVAIRIPLTTPSLVQSITVQWGADRTMPWNGWRFGGGMEFTVSALRLGSNTFKRSITSTGSVNVVSIGAEADELVIDLTRKDPKIDFYSIAEISVAGASVSLPAATGPAGTPNSIGSQYPVFAAVDGNFGTAWVSGSNAPVTLKIPLNRSSTVTGMSLQWNCQSIGNLGRAGAAAVYAIRARNNDTGAFIDVPYARQHRSADGREQVVFGVNGSPQSIVTDELELVLLDTELGVDLFSLREVTLQNGWASVPVRRPSATATYPFDPSYSVGRAFDNEPLSEWASASGSATSAIAVPGNNVKVTKVKIVGFAAKAAAECFPINLSPQFSAPYHVTVGNVLVEDCIISDPAPGNKNGISAIVAVAGWPNVLTNSVIRRCTVTGLKSHFTYSHGVSANLVEQCVVTDCFVGSYWECMPGVSDYGHITVRSNLFADVTLGVYFRMHAGTQFRTMECLNNEIILSGSGGWGIGACDLCDPGPSGKIGGLAALGNVIRYADWKERPGTRDAGIYYSDIENAVIGNNIVAIGPGADLRVRHCPAGAIYPPPEPDNCDVRPVNPPAPPVSASCLDSLLPGYRRAWFNNRSLSGGLLDVMIYKNGVDGMAAQQQWGR